MTQELIQKFLSNKTNKILLAIFLILGILSIKSLIPPTPKVEEPPQTADTYIPEGMVLIPIEIQNKEALDGIMGSFGVVDLYSPGYGDQIKAKHVASGVKIMRAPLNPDVYAVLVSEDKALHITEHAGPFFVAIQSPHKNKSRFKKSKSRLQVLTEDV